MKSRLTLVTLFVAFCLVISGCDNSGSVQKVDPKDVKEIPTTRTEENPPAQPFNDAIKDNPNIPEGAKKTMLRDSGSSTGG